MFCMPGSCSKQQNLLDKVLQVLSDSVAVDSSSDTGLGDTSKVQHKRKKESHKDDDADDLKDLKKDLCTAFGAMNVRASMERNKSAASILEKYNRSLEHAANIRAKIADYCMRIAEMQASNKPLHQIEPLLDLIVELHDTAAKAFKANDDLKAQADALAQEGHHNDMEEELEMCNLQELCERCERCLDAILAGKDDIKVDDDE
jgi:Na+/phosphate symporter